MIIDNVSWRWLFLVGAIPVAVAIVLVHRFVPESPVKSPSRVDVPGALLFSGGLTALLLGLTEGERWGWTSPRIVGLVVGAARLLVGWVIVELRTPQPMVEMRMLTNRPVLLTNLTALIAGFAMFSSFVLVPALRRGPVEHAATASARARRRPACTCFPSSIAMLFAGPLAGVLGAQLGLEVAARGRDAARSASASPCSPRCTTSRGRSSSRWSRSASGSRSRSPRWRR